jgi:hypothetical protein
MLWFEDGHRVYGFKTDDRAFKVWVDTSDID